MKAIILAAGFGNRMKPLTYDLHKTLLKVGEYTIIDRILIGLIDNQVTDIVVATGYRAEELSNYLVKTHGHICQFTFVENKRFRETNNIHSLALVFEQVEFDKDVILIESDLIYEPAVIKKLIDSRYPNVALVDRYRSGMDGTVVSLNGDIVSNVIPPHLQGKDFDFSDKYKTLNIYKFSKQFCQNDFRKILTYYSSTIDDNCYYELILGFLIYMQREAIHAAVVDGLKWTEVDDPNDLRLAEFVFNESKKMSILENSWGGLWGYAITDFCFIRNMYFPTPSIISEMKNNLFNLVTNYGSSQKILNEKLAYFTLLPLEKLVLLNGASQVFPLLALYFKDKKALLPQPSFGEYSKTFEKAEYFPDTGDYLKEFEKALKSSDAEVVVIVNPNNPTGSTIPSEKLLRSLEEYPKKFFIIDESFIDFADTTSLETLSQVKHQNLLIVKSLSKTLGVPGVRLGYVFTHHVGLREFILSQVPIWNANSLAEFFLEIILKHRNSIQKSYRQTIDDREDFRAKLASSKFVECVFPSGANYILVKFKLKPAQTRKLAADLLAQRSLYVKEISGKFNDGSGYMRLAVRLPSENDQLVQALNEISEAGLPI